MFGGLIILVGAALLTAAIAKTMSTRAFISRASVAEGVVVSLFASGTHPNIEFTSATGRKINYTQGGFIFGYRTGDRVNVLYLPDDPNQPPCIDSLSALWFMEIILFSLAVLFLVGGFQKIIDYS
ncbi:MAG: DUF3592 domain-containing protein [Roseiarcus sp.]